MRATRIMAAVSALALLGACADEGPKQQIGAVLGGIGGAVAGAQFGSGTGRLVGVAAGTMIGALLGSEVGKSLDRADMGYMRQTNYQAFEYGRSGTAQTWRNPDSGNYGAVVPRPAYQTATGQYCREFQQSITVGGRSEQGYGTACRQPDGSWQIVN